MFPYDDPLDELEQAIVDDLLHEHYIDIVDDFLNDEDDIDPAGGHGLFSHI